MRLGVIWALLGPIAQSNAEPLLEQAAKQYKLPVALLRAIASVESRNNPDAINRRTWDYGLMQINHRTAAGYGYLPVEMLDKQKNVQVASQLLKKLKNSYAHKEPGWACRYNVGWHKNASQWSSCRVYLEKLCEAGYCILSNQEQ